MPFILSAADCNQKQVYTETDKTQAGYLPDKKSCLPEQTITKPSRNEESDKYESCQTNENLKHVKG